MKRFIHLLTNSYNTLRSQHPIVNSLLLGTVLARAASSMSMPFLAIYLSKTTSMSAVMIGFVIGAGSLAGMFGGFIGGALSDRFGRRIIMMTALFGWVLAFIGFSVFKTPLIIMLLNMVNGLCRSFYEPVSQALMADLTPKERRFQMFSLRYLAINIGVAIGPLLGAYFGMRSGTTPFLITGIIYFIYAVVLYGLLLSFGIKQIEGDKKPKVTIAATWRVVRQDVTLRYYLIGGIIGAIGYSQMTVTLSQYVNNSVTDGVALFAWLMTVNAIVVVAFQIPLTKWAEKRAPLVAISVGNILFALGDLGFAFSWNAITFLLSMAVFTLGEVLNFPSSNLLVDELAPDEMRGVYYGAQSFNSLGFFLGPWVGGMLLLYFGGGTLFTVMAVITVMSTSLYKIGLRRVERG
ncbi:MDR family MFS transporter [Paenibacillus guangzhouensis]|uniref:MDR family MFS transporter n=1 Tax=Paenibacillus guangzhouensis TaxID=1473112 RepID=UPI00126764BB|nr:MFS transporter [Paenibacillus guangzhouensis]